MVTPSDAPRSDIIRDLKTLIAQRYLSTRFGDSSGIEWHLDYLLQDTLYVARIQIKIKNYGVF